VLVPDEHAIIVLGRRSGMNKNSWDKIYRTRGYASFMELMQR